MGLTWLLSLGALNVIVSSAPTISPTASSSPTQTDTPTDECVGGFISRCEGSCRQATGFVCDYLESGDSCCAYSPCYPSDCPVVQYIKPSVSVTYDIADSKDSGWPGTLAFDRSGTFLTATSRRRFLDVFSRALPNASHPLRDYRRVGSLQRRASSTHTASTPQEGWGSTAVADADWLFVPHPIANGRRGRLDIGPFDPLTSSYLTTGPRAQLIDGVAGGVGFGTSLHRLGDTVAVTSTRSADGAVQVVLVTRTPNVGRDQMGVWSKTSTLVFEGGVGAAAQVRLHSTAGDDDPDMVFVSAPHATVGSVVAGGKVAVFVRSGAVWGSVPAKTLTAPIPTAGGKFGSSLVSAGSYLFVASAVDAKLGEGARKAGAPRGVFSVGEYWGLPSFEGGVDDGAVHVFSVRSGGRVDATHVLKSPHSVSQLGGLSMSAVEVEDGRVVVGVGVSSRSCGRGVLPLRAVGAVGCEGVGGAVLWRVSPPVSWWAGASWEMFGFVQRPVEAVVEGGMTTHIGPRFGERVAIAPRRGGFVLVVSDVADAFDPPLPRDENVTFEREGPFASSPVGAVWIFDYENGYVDRDAAWGRHEDEILTYTPTPTYIPPLFEE